MCNSLLDVGCAKCDKHLAVAYSHAIRYLCKETVEGRNPFYALMCVAFLEVEPMAVNGKLVAPVLDNKRLVPICANVVKCFESLAAFWLYYEIADLKGVKISLNSKVSVTSQLNEFQTIDDIENSLATIGKEVNSLEDLKFFMESSLATIEYSHDSQRIDSKLSDDAAGCKGLRRLLRRLSRVWRDHIMLAVERVCRR